MPPGTESSSPRKPIREPSSASRRQGTRLLKQELRLEKKFPSGNLKEHFRFGRAHLLYIQGG
jgi:hypothetical protein